MSTLIPEHVRSHCQLCPTVEVGIEAMAAHQEQAHGHTVQRWPDGGLVVDASAVPELLGGA